MIFKILIVNSKFQCGDDLLHSRSTCAHHCAATDCWRVLSEVINGVTSGVPVTTSPAWGISLHWRNLNRIPFAAAMGVSQTAIRELRRYNTRMLSSRYIITWLNPVGLTRLFSARVTITPCASLCFAKLITVPVITATSSGEAAKRSLRKRGISDPYAWLCAKFI